MKCPICDGKMEAQSLLGLLTVLLCSGAVGYGEDGCGYWIPCDRDGRVPGGETDE